MALEMIRLDPGDPAGWDRFYTEVAPKIRVQLFMLGVRDRGRIDDLTQDVLTRFLRYGRWRKDWRTLPVAGDLIAYIRRMARNVFFDDQVSRRQQMRFESPQHDSADVNFDQLPGTVEDLNVRLSQIAKRLSRSNRVLLRLLLDGRSVQDIAEALGIGYSAAGLRIHRLRAKVRMLGEDLM